MAIKDSRRELRLTAKDDSLLVEAAGLIGMTVSEFLLSKALPDAEAIVDEHHTITLTEDAYARFCEALDRTTTAP